MGCTHRGAERILLVLVTALLACLALPAADAQVPAIWGGDVTGDPPAFLVPVNQAVGATQFYDMGFGGGSRPRTRVSSTPT